MMGKIYCEWTEGVKTRYRRKEEGMGGYVKLVAIAMSSKREKTER